ncbi:MAG: LytTR family DNA-binding domain-containing protein [Rubrivivax sp.]|nr:LytTR family DNA-binding domain-containing protein [Rubrivivax sp.]
MARLKQRLAQATPAPDATGLQALLAQLSTQVKRPPQLAVLQASVDREVRLIRTDEVVYFESDSRYTRVVFDGPAGSGDALIRTPLKELLAQLDEQKFRQVHRSVIVNHRHVAAAVRVDEGHMHLTLRGRAGPRRCRCRATSRVFSRDSEGRAGGDGGLASSAPLHAAFAARRTCPPCPSLVSTSSTATPNSPACCRTMPPLRRTWCSCTAWARVSRAATSGCCR